MEDYTQRRLTLSRDRLPALAGLVNLYQIRRQDEPLLGLWRKSLHKDLMWKRSKVVSERPLDPELAQPLPSWSPLSCRQAIDFDAWGNRRADGQTEMWCLKICHCAVEWAGRPFVSAMTSTSLTINAPVRETYLCEATQITGCNPPYFNVDNEEVDIRQDPLPWRCAVQWDVEAYRPPQTWLCILVKRRAIRGYELGGETFLIVKLVGSGDAHPRYCRVGIGSLGRSRGEASSLKQQWKFDLNRRRTISLI